MFDKEWDIGASDGSGAADGELDMAEAFAGLAKLIEEYCTENPADCEEWSKSPRKIFWLLYVSHGW